MAASRCWVWAFPGRGGKEQSQRDQVVSVSIGWAAVNGTRVLVADGCLVHIAGSRISICELARLEEGGMQLAIAGRDSGFGFMARKHQEEGEYNGRGSRWGRV